MNAVYMLWTLIGGAALMLAGVHGLLWLLDRRRTANLAFCIVTIGVAALSAADVGMMHAGSPVEYGEWVRWFQIPNFVVVVGLVAFIHLQFGTGRMWLAGVIVVLRAVVLIVNFLAPSNATWSEISRLERIPFLGEQVSVVAAATVRPFQALGSLASLLFLVYVADALVTAWRKGGRETRRKALVICGAILAFVAIAILESQLVVWNVVRMPVVVAPPFLILMAAITYELSRDLVASARAEVEMQRLRDDLAHVTRVSTMSQLSGSLAHELTQPLTAILLNAQTAENLLQKETPDLVELRAILADIRDDDRRAAAILERTRALVKREYLAFDDVSLHAIARDVLGLVRADAIKRGVEVESSVPDNLPRVRADRVQVSQVLLNLVVNAMDSVSATASGERWISVAANLSDPRTVQVSVVDSGHGIPAELLHRVFDPFVTTKRDGLGIGLAVARAIVETHGGQLWAENNPHGGATFRFEMRVSAPG